MSPIPQDEHAEPPETTEWRKRLLEFANQILRSFDQGHDHRVSVSMTDYEDVMAAAVAPFATRTPSPPADMEGRREQIARLIFDKAVGLHQWENDFYLGERLGCFETADAILALPAVTAEAAAIMMTALKQIEPYLERWADEPECGKFYGIVHDAIEGAKAVAALPALQRGVPDWPLSPPEKWLATWLHRKDGEASYRELVCAFLAEQPALQRTVPAGWQLVPKEITEDMAAEMECAWGTEEQWMRALKAAPAPPAFLAEQPALQRTVPEPVVHAIERSLVRQIVLDATRGDRQVNTFWIGEHLLVGIDKLPILDAKPAPILAEKRGE